MISLIETIVVLTQQDEREEVVAVARKVAGQVLGKGRLPLQTKVFLLLVREMVVKKGCGFSREKVRVYTGWKRQEVKIHFDRLLKMGYFRQKKRLFTLRTEKKRVVYSPSFPNGDE